MNALYDHTLPGHKLSPYFTRTIEGCRYLFQLPPASKRRKREPVREEISFWRWYAGAEWVAVIAPPTGLVTDAFSLWPAQS